MFENDRFIVLVYMQNIFFTEIVFYIKISHQKLLERLALVHLCPTHLPSLFH